MAISSSMILKAEIFIVYFFVARLLTTILKMRHNYEKIVKDYIERSNAKNKN